MVEPIAIYLPQFHEIEENNLWWGKGFTEWVNVKEAKPSYNGHYQPHIPHKSIGYYDLSDEAFLIRQHQLAYRYGVKNFCYYYYNFNGKTLLEKPLRSIISRKEIKNRFCLCWANENWTRVWYGMDKKVLIAQEYSEAHAVRFIQDITPYLTHERYICVDNKPMLLVYRPELVEDCQRYAEIWRREARALGFADLYLVAVEALSHDVSPQEYGFDAALEFAPDWRMTHLISPPEQKPRVFDYPATVANMLQKAVPDYTRFRCVFPSWDNSPRYKGGGVLFENTSLGAFLFFLENTIKYTKEKVPENAQYFFINAWNEWGEGCHLEPDERNGLSFLQILHKALMKA
ncbi:glycosyltransferase WbsX family protein [Desulfovibrio litoralis]|uniref:Glycosyltransferase WbsX n=1 Tax=Desulfovibrio litoralis DSM 11393 TaxID=1121455 RepID=A0A1M7TBE5_9BACT|nr:glycoside hydrolase family 99-like domain-containing protein [Desulfovibrio litoralis]SHN68079.1 Glycosyltransferase WbsX [Desulfovibrio litoralis DSM 11393]